MPSGSRQEERKPQDIVVFSIVRESACAECGRELGKGSFLRMEDERPLCLTCADLGRLVYLPRGDAALGLAVRTHVRHRHTRYDALLGAGRSREDARAEIDAVVEAILAGWRGHAAEDRAAAVKG